MAQLKPFRSVWYARSRWRVDGIRKEKLIPLKTKSKVVARERLVEVNKLEKDIQNGMNFTFSWMSEDSITKVKRFTLIDAYDKWLSRSTVNIYA